VSVDAAGIVIGFIMARAARETNQTNYTHFAETIAIQWRCLRDNNMKLCDDVVTQLHC
jgi:hypothetical protein